MTTDPGHDDRRGIAAAWPGIRARTPRAIPLGGWRQVGGRVWRAIGEDHLMLMAAALAFWGIMALFPLLIAAITVYGFVADPQQVRELLSSVAVPMSGGAGEIVSTQLEQIVASSRGALTLGLVLSLVIAIWSASTGVLNLMSAVNVAYGERESRSWWWRRVMALLLTVGTVGFIAVTVALIAILPAMLHLFGLGNTSQTVVSLLRWPMLLVFGMAALAIVYMVGPDRRPPRLTWVSWGAVVAVALWLAGSYGFSAYVENFGSYNEVYGSLGSVVVLLMWFYLTSFSILLGAEINAEIELQTGIDTTRGPERPRGERGAVKADGTPCETRWPEHRNRHRGGT